MKIVIDISDELKHKNSLMGLDRLEKKDIIEVSKIISKGIPLEECEDCISRAEAIEINKKYHGKMPNDINHQIWEEINALPSVQPKPKTDVLDKIRAEIEEKKSDILSDTLSDMDCGIITGLEWAIDIIDKYKAESEDKK